MSQGKVNKRKRLRPGKITSCLFQELSPCFKSVSVVWPVLTSKALSFLLMVNQPAEVTAFNILSYEQTEIISPYFLVSFCLWFKRDSWPLYLSLPTPKRDQRTHEGARLLKQLPKSILLDKQTSTGRFFSCYVPSTDLFPPQRWGGLFCHHRGNKKG